MVNTPDVVTAGQRVPAPGAIGADSVVAVLVPHTHWDREWYAPFEAMRFHLLQFLDEVVEVLEQEPELPVFLLDGQAVMLEDYLEVRRTQRDRVLALVAAGRLRPGPFYVQPDEFHVSGEAIVRNLLVGIAVSREFGWVMREGYLPDTFGHVSQLPQILRGFGIETLLDRSGAAVPFAVLAAEEVTVADALNRRKELLPDRLSFRAADVPALGTAVYQLVAPSDDPTPAPAEETTRRGGRVLENDALRVEVEPEGTLRVTSRATGRSFGGLLELLDEGDAGDAGDEYGFGPVTGDQPISFRAAQWSVGPAADPHALVVEGTLGVPASLTPDRSARSAALGELPVALTVRLRPGADRVEVEVGIDNRVRDHRLRLRFPTGTSVGASVAETAYGLIRRHRELPSGQGWQEPPSGAFGLRRFVAQEDDEAGLQVLTEGLYEYSCPTDGVLDVTLLRGVAGSIMAVAPVVLLFVLLQRQIVGALTSGAVKG